MAHGHVRRHPESPASAPACWRGPRWWQIAQVLNPEAIAQTARPRKNWSRQAGYAFEACRGDDVRDFALDRTGWAANRTAYAAWCSGPQRAQVLRRRATT